MDLYKINFSCDWEFFSPDWDKSHLNSINWECGLISAPETSEKNPCGYQPSHEQTNNVVFEQVQHMIGEIQC